MHAHSRLGHVHEPVDAECYQSEDEEEDDDDDGNGIVLFDHCVGFCSPSRWAKTRKGGVDGSGWSNDFPERGESRTRRWSISSDGGLRAPRCQ